MSVSISSDIVIGNFLIEMVKRDIYQFEIQKLYDFDNQLSARLKKHNYYTKFIPLSVFEFIHDYPFFVKSFENNMFVIASKVECDDRFKCLLERYFRLGVPSVVINEMRECVF